MSLFDIIFVLIFFFKLIIIKLCTNYKLQITNYKLQIVIFLLLIFPKLASTQIEPVDDTGVVWNTATGVFTWTFNPCADDYASWSCNLVAPGECERVANWDKCRKACDNLPLSDKEWLACRNKCGFNTVQLLKQPVGLIITTTFTQNEFDPFDRDQQYTYPYPLTLVGNGFEFGPFQNTVTLQTNYVNLDHYCFGFRIILLMSDGTQCSLDVPFFTNCYDF